MAADLGVLQRLPKIVPQGVAREMAYTGERLGAERALAVGLVNAVLPDAAATARPRDGAGRGRSPPKSPLAIAGSKLALNHARDHSTASALQQMTLLQSAIFDTGEMATAIAAWKEKRSAEFAPLTPGSQGLASRSPLGTTKERHAMQRRSPIRCCSPHGCWRLRLGTASAQDIRVTLLGTGTPAPVMNRFGPSILVEAGEQKFLFDAGRGAMQRLTQIGVELEDVTGVFLTHLHSDHVVGFPDLWLTGWLFGERAVPLSGLGTARHAEDDARTSPRPTNTTSPSARPTSSASAAGALIVAEDVAEGFAYESNGVRITPFDVDHAPVEPAFGYRIDYRGRSVVLSGDTRFSENLIRRAEGVDLLIHEVAAPATHLRAGIPPARRRDDHGASHDSPEQAGEVFAARQAQARGLFAHRPPDDDRAGRDRADAQGLRGPARARRGPDGDRDRRHGHGATAAGATRERAVALPSAPRSLSAAGDRRNRRVRRRADLGALVPAAAERAVQRAPCSAAAAPASAPATAATTNSERCASSASR